MTATIEICKNSTEQNALPRALVSYLDGNKLNERVGEAICVTTIDHDGWPHASLLSVGEVVAVDASHLNLAVHANASTAKNLKRDGRVSLSMVHDHALWEILLNAKAVARSGADSELAMFKAQVKIVRVHRVNYADVLSSITYSLHDKIAVVDRWKHQVGDLRALMAA